MVGTDRDDVATRGHHRRGVEAGELEAAGEEAVLVGRDVAVAGGLLEQQQEIGWGMRHGELVLWLDAGQTDQAIGDDVEEPDHGAEHEREAPERPRQGDSRGLGVRDRPRLGRHLTHDHVEEHDERERDGEPDRVQRPVGNVDDPRQTVLDETCDRRFGDRAEEQRADRDAELGAGEHQRELADSCQGVMRSAVAAGGELLDPGPARREEGELGGDEEPVGGEQDDCGGDRDRGAHDSSPPSWWSFRSPRSSTSPGSSASSGSSTSAGVSRIVVTAQPSIVSTSRTDSATST